MTQTLAATFHLTHQCNLRCTYCYTGTKVHRPMSREVANKSLLFVLDEARKAQVKFLDITFFGGEPLIEAELLFWLADSFQEKLPPGMTLSFRISTNGTLLTETMMQALAQRDIYVSLSVDGVPEIQDIQRPNAAGKGSSAAIEKAIPILLHSNPCASVTTVLTPNSAGHAAESIDWLYQKGFRYFNLTLDYSADWTMEDMHRLEKSYHKLAHWYEEKTQQNQRFYLSCFDERIRSHTQGPPGRDERCNLGQRQFSIAPDGALYPCIQFVTTETLPEFMIGHVLHGGFDENCREHLHSCSEKPKDACSTCALQGRCASWCSCINFASTGTVTQASPVVCYHERTLMPLVDAMANRLWRKRNQQFLHKHYNPLYPMIDYLEHLV
ncbi:MAG: radical SAM protein [Haliscomenobacter sp.]|uniref:radical SAM/SPASM domain-containing protein n=1 Tax=Haliscomenobacter sp. TaxID=2717303 RepID=UPI0029AE1442|nr:radical SAM protein [Haliscomenobacter sp.]MDX2071627.1 radical SAM protein [Haliscomenobacter sp.]